MSDESKLQSFQEGNHNLSVTVVADSTLCEADRRKIFDWFLEIGPNEAIYQPSRVAVVQGSSTLKFGALKIKGAGYQRTWLDGSTGPQRVAFTRRHTAAYSVPRYDFEGNATIDVAKDWHRAFLGGMTMQQAVNEYRVIRHLTSRGFETFPAVAMGSITNGKSTSWFCVLDYPWRPGPPPPSMFATHDDCEKIGRFMGETQLQLQELGAYMALFGVTYYDGRLLRKDFHPVHLTGPNDSVLSLLSYQLFDTSFNLAYFSFKLSARPDDELVARRTYLEVLTGVSATADEIAAFAKTLVTLELNNTLEGLQRLDLIRETELGRAFVERSTRGRDLVDAPFFLGTSRAP